VSHHQVIQPSGTEGRYGVVHMKNIATGVVPIDEEGYTWLVGQWRYPLNAYSWEIPEGGGDPHRSSLEAIQRELLEETGLEASEWTFIQELHLSNSVTDELAHIYFAKGIKQVAAPSPEPSEKLTLQRLPLAEAIQMVEQGEITDAISVVGLLKAKTLTLF
jgi:8-oxo-dGTP pyrophosphatase MutT (NUDIX family)